MYLTLNTRFVILIIIIQCLFGNRQYLYLNINTWAVMTSLLSACLVFGNSSIWISIIPAETLFSEPGNNMNSNIAYVIWLYDWTKTVIITFLEKLLPLEIQKKWMLGSQLYILVWQKQKCFLKEHCVRNVLTKSWLPTDQKLGKTCVNACTIIPVPLSSKAVASLLLLEAKTGRHSRKCEETRVVSPVPSVFTRTMCIGSHIDNMVVGSAILLASPVKRIKNVLFMDTCINCDFSVCTNISEVFFLFLDT